MRTLTQAYPGALPRSTEVGVDLLVLLFACGVAIATMFFGLAQLRHIGRKDLAVTLTEAGAKAPALGHAVTSAAALNDYFETMGIPSCAGAAFRQPMPPPQVLSPRTTGSSVCARPFSAARSREESVAGILELSPRSPAKTS